MFALDLFNTDHERRLAEGAVDQLEQRRIDDLAMKMDDLVARAKQAKDPAHRAALVKEFQRVKAERDNYFKIKDECMGYGTLVGEQDGIGKDLVTPQQRVKQAQPQKQTPVGKVVDTAKQAAKWLAGKGGPGKEGPTYEDQNQKKKFRATDTSNELRKIRAKYPAAGSDAEAILKRDLDTDKEQDKAIQSLSVVTKDLETKLDKIKQPVSAPVAPPTTTSAPAPIPSIASAPAANVPVPPTKPAAPSAVVAAPVVPEPAVAEPSATTTAQAQPAPVTAKTAVARPKAKRTATYTQKAVEPKTKLQMPTGATAAKTPDNVIDIRSKLSGAGLPGVEPLRRAAESVNEEEASPVIGQMVQTLTAPNIEKDNIKAFRDAYEATKACKLNYGGSAKIPLSFTTMDGIVSVLTAYPPEKQKEIWHKLFTDANYLHDFLRDNVPQRGMFEADIIPLAQQRQAPAQLKAYNLALQILKSARDPNVSDATVNQMKQSLFHDFGTRIQQAPDKSYYMVFQGKKINLPNPASFPLEETNVDTLIARRQAATKAMPKIDAKLAQSQAHRQDLEKKMAALDAELAKQGERDAEYWRTHSPRATRLKDPSAKLESTMSDLDAMRQDYERLKPNQFKAMYGIEPEDFFRKYRAFLKPAPQQTVPAFDRTAEPQPSGFYKKNEFDIGEGFQDFKKVEPYAVCLAGKPVKQFDYYEQARRYHDNWKKKLYNTGKPEDKAKADKITLMPIMDEGWKSKLAGAALAGATAVGSPAAHAAPVQAGALQQALSQQLKKPALPQPQIPKEKEKTDDNKDKAPITQADIKEETGSWIVYDPETKQIKKRFKTHTAGKSYARAHGLGFASAEYYFDNIKEPVNELDVNTLKSYADKRGAQVAAMKADNPNPTPGSKEWIQQAVPAQQVNLANRKIARKERQQGVAEVATDYSRRRQREKDIDAGKPVARQPKNPQTDYAKKRAKQKKELELGEDSSTSSEEAESAILKRIMVAHLGLLKEFGPEKVMQAVEEVAYNVGDLDEIGSSDVSGWVRQVEQILGVADSEDEEDEEFLDEKWSKKYKRSIDCSHPKGFSQRAHCAGRKK